MEKNGHLLRQLRQLYWATIALFLGAAALGVFVFIDSGNKADAFRAEQVKLATLAKTTKKSLCNLRHDLELRVAAEQAYLDKTPHAIPGVTPAQIRANIANQRRTIASLDDLHCGRAPPKNPR